MPLNPQPCLAGSRGGWIAAWVQREDGTRETASARSVVIYDAGEWVEYGSDGSGEAFQAELYGAAGSSGEQQAARLARFLGQAGRPQAADDPSVRGILKSAGGACVMPVPSLRAFPPEGLQQQGKAG